MAARKGNANFPCGRNLVISIKLEMHKPFDPEIPPLGNYPLDTYDGSLNKMCVSEGFWQK